MLAWVLALASVLPVPFVAQEEDTCGAAALAMVLQFWGEPSSQDAIARELFQPELHGILGSRLADWAQKRGLTAVAYEGDMEQLRVYVDKGRPLIVAWKLKGGRFHNVVVVGFDDQRRQVLVNDPGEGPARGVALDVFEKRWAGADHWTLLVLPKAK